MLRASNDSKVRCRKSHYNSLGLMPGLEHTCPFATTCGGGCYEVSKSGRSRTCYAHKLMKAWPNVRKLLEQNTNLLKNTDEEGMYNLLRDEFNRFHKESEGHPDSHRIYRLHWSGDIFSQEYANALTRAMSEFPDIRFWCYTRSLEYVSPAMITLENLSLYISTDICNYKESIEWYKKQVNAYKLSPTVTLPGIAYMGESIPDDLAAYAKELGISTVNCPTDHGLPTEGACNKCRKCVDSENNLIFYVKR